MRPDGVLTVATVDQEEFAVMSRVLRPQFVRHGLVDEDGAWYSPRFSGSRLKDGNADQAAGTLLRRLSPAFRFPGTDPAMLPASFQGLLTGNVQVSEDGSAFQVTQGTDKLFVKLVALADWNGDGRDDWLVLCRIEPTAVPGARRDYYLALTDLAPAVLLPEVLGIRDCVGRNCRVLGSASEPGLVEDSPSVDVPQGQYNVTEPPSSLPPRPSGAPRASVQSGDSGLTERKLSE